MDKYWPRYVQFTRALAILACHMTLDGTHDRRNDACEDIANDLHGKLHKLDNSTYQLALLRHMLRTCRRVAKNANEMKPSMANLESLVKGCVVPFISMSHLYSICVQMCVYCSCILAGGYIEHMERRSLSERCRLDPLGRDCQCPHGHTTLPMGKRLCPSAPPTQK
jgi:hypothetical protein